MDKKIFEFVYVAAMIDATLHKSFVGKKAWMTDCSKFKNSTDDLKALVSDVIAGNFANNDSYDDRFLKVSIELCEEINSYPENKGYGHFTFGNAQKLINIIMKYFYIHTYGNEKEKVNFQFCHCPMDSQLLKKVWDKRKKLSENTKNNLDKRDEFLKSWGSLDFQISDGKKGFPDCYKVFQEAVKELSKYKSQSPLEFDYDQWGSVNTN